MFGSLGMEQTDVKCLSFQCSNEGHANTVSCLESFQVSLEEVNEKN